MNVIITSAIIAAVALVGYVSYLCLGPDNKVEEACEQVIQVETGSDIDLSPSATGPTAPTGPAQNIILSGQTADEIVDAVVEGITKKS